MQPATATAARQPTTQRQLPAAKPAAPEAKTPQSTIPLPPVAAPRADPMPRAEPIQTLCPPAPKTEIDRRAKSFADFNNGLFMDIDIESQPIQLDNTDQSTSSSGPPMDKADVNFIEKI